MSTPQDLRKLHNANLCQGISFKSTSKLRVATRNASLSSYVVVRLDSIKTCVSESRYLEVMAKGLFSEKHLRKPKNIARGTARFSGVTITPNSC